MVLQSADLLDYGLMVLYEMVFNQSSLLTGHESLVFSFLLEVRYAKKLNVGWHTLCPLGRADISFPSRFLRLLMLFETY